MPQARRKTPFSGKAKKQQLQSKKQHKTVLLSQSPTSSQHDVVALNYQPSTRGGRGDRNKYALKFYRESDAELMIKKEEALKRLNYVPEKDLEINPSKYFPEDLSFPKRPPWNYEMTPAQLDAQEHRYFTEYVTTLEKSAHWKEMSYFELNLETWRQLWRVLEMCDILLLIVDVRYATDHKFPPSIFKIHNIDNGMYHAAMTWDAVSKENTGCMFPPSLYEYIKQAKKHMILVLNKIDLVPASAVAAWTSYMKDRYPELQVVYFTSCSGYNLVSGTADKGGLQIRRRKGRQRMCVEGATKLVEACKKIVGQDVDISSWEKKVQSEGREATAGNDDEDAAKEIGETIIQKADTSFFKHERYANGVLTLGCVGQPNVGKSSLLNAIMGKKVVSVSKTPGHTKHFQTIYLTQQVRLCDCPGLVFPSTVPRAIQILMGSYPIAQLREPYSTIRYLAERLDLPKLLRIDHPENDEEWSPTDICNGWAKKRQYFTAKAARLDTYRAANSLLRMALDGKICLWLRPPGFTENKEKYENSPEIKYIKWVQAIQGEDVAVDSATDNHTDEEDEEDSSSNKTDSDTDGSDDNSEVARAMANKFAALASDD